ncbi:MAG: hypothetical protein JWL83_1106 [Actinomycetia bacterium]|nr:hypothetical protein [Actinomycetes bacterium]
MTIDDHKQQAKYLPAGRGDRLMNRVVVGLTRLGISVMGSRELRVRGRTSGEWRTNPVNLLDVDGRRYLVAPRGEVQWVRNLRAAGGHGELRVGRRTESFEATEIAGDDKLPMLRAYLERWSWEVGRFFDGVNAKASDDELRRIAASHPVFALK